MPSRRSASGLIQVGHCLDFTDERNTGVLASAWDQLRSTLEEAGAPLPHNRGRDEDLPLRFRDCAVINHLVDAIGGTYQTVRGAWVFRVYFFGGRSIGVFLQAGDTCLKPRFVVGPTRMPS